MKRLSVALAALLACTPAVEPVVTVSIVGSADGTLTLEGRIDEELLVALRDASVRVHVDGASYTSKGATCTSDDTTLLDCALDDGLALTLTRTTSEAGAVLEARVKGLGDKRLDGIELLTGTLELPKSASRLRYLHNGYESASFAGVLDVPDGTTLARTEGIPVYGAPNARPTDGEAMGVSSHSIVIDTGGDAALVLGFTSAKRLPGAFALETNDATRTLTVLNGFTGAPTAAKSGSVASERLFVALGTSAQQAMAAYGEALDDERDRSLDGKGHGQRGWMSGSRFFDAISEALVLEQASRIKTLLPGAGPLVGLDDGWQTAIGDWTANEDFSSVSDLVQKLKTSGNTLGLWVAPFVVDASLAVVEENPEWWVRAAPETPLEVTLDGSDVPLRVVDTTHPDALAWAVANVTRLKREGVSFFKLDALSFAGMDGVRKDAEATGTEALSKGLQALVGALETANVNLVGTPWLHAALAPGASIRTGADVTFKDAEMKFAYVASAARNLAARSFGPLALRSDIGAFRITHLKDGEARTALAWQLATASTLTLGDDVGQLSTEQRAFVNKTLQATPIPEKHDKQLAYPADLFATAATTLLDTPKTANEKEVVAPTTMSGYGLHIVTNWGDVPLEVKLPSGRRFTSVWNGQQHSGKITVEPHDTACLR